MDVLPRVTSDQSAAGGGAVRGRRSGGCGSEDAEEGYMLFRWRIRLPTTFGGIIPSSIQRKNEASRDGTRLWPR